MPRVQEVLKASHSYKMVIVIFGGRDLEEKKEEKEMTETKTGLDEKQTELIDLLSLEAALNDIQMIYEIGEKAVGTSEETKAANLIKRKFEEIGLKNVRLEPYQAICRTYKSSEFEMLSPVRKKVSCRYGACSAGTPRDGITAQIIDAGFGTIRDFERLRNSGINVKDNILLIERNDRITLWPNVPVHQASEYGVAAVVFTSVIEEHSALKTDVVPNASIPVLFIPYIEAQEIRDLLRKGKVEANLKNIVEVDERGVSYNVIGELPGSKFSDQIITVTAHHDSWFGAANDNASGVAAVINIARVLAKNYKPARTIRFISFGGEESGTNDFFYWLVGSDAYIKQHTKELKRIIANINFDCFAYGSKCVINATPELTSLVKELIDDLGFGIFYDVVSLPSTGVDSWSFVRAGIPSLNFGDSEEYYKIYHTDYDIPALINRDLMKHAMQIALLLTLKLDSSELLPYDFSLTSEILLNDITTRRKRVENVVDIGKTLNQAAALKTLAEEFNQQKISTTTQKLSESVISSINASQRDICYMLNTNLINTKMDTWAFHEAWMVPYYLDMLTAVKRTIDAMKEGDIGSALSYLKGLTTMSWGVNVSLNVYEKILAMTKSSRHLVLVINLMPELHSLQEKLRIGNRNIDREISSAEKKYGTLRNQIKEKFRDINDSLSNSASELLKSICKILRASET